MDLIVEIIRSSLPAAIPILLAALGGLYTYHANVFNIAMEGMLLASAFGAVAGSYVYESWWAGMLFGIIASLIISLLFALFTIVMRTGEFVTGIAINLLALGGTTYLLRQMFHVKGALISPRIKELPVIDIPFIDHIPYVGQILNHHSFPVYLSIFIIVPLVYLHLYKMRFGLRLRASGQDDRVVDSVGVSSRSLKLKSILICGILCGIGGVFLSLGYMTLFTENMSNGRGWISLAVIIITRGHPIGVLALGILFGLFDGLGLSLQNTAIPSQFTYMMPYLATLVALFFYSYKRTGKKSLT